MTGSGTQADPYIISDVDDLQAMENNLGAYYELANDIDASATVGWNGGEGFRPVGKQVNEYLLPTGDIADVGTWTLEPAGGTFASKVQTDDGDDSYIMAQSNDCEVIFSHFANIPQTAKNISVRVGARRRNTASGTSTMKSLLRIGGVDYPTPDSSWTQTIYGSIIFHLHSTNPATGLPWTVNEVNGVGPNSIEGFGVAVTDATPNVRFTFICMLVMYEDPFTGQLDGKNHKITDLYIDKPDEQILLGFIAYSSVALLGLVNTSKEIKNVGMVDGDITGGSSAGFINGLQNGAVTNCYFTGNVEGRASAAGFVIRNENGVISNCYATGSIVGDVFGASGFVDRNDGVVSTCWSSGDVTSTQGSAAGFCGDNYGSIGGCSTACTVSAPNTFWHDAGGFCVYNDGEITKCYATGNVSGYSAGGFSGYSNLESECYATGDVLGVHEAAGYSVSGGLLIINCYARGNATATEPAVGEAGGFIVYNYEAIGKCYSTGLVTADVVGGFCVENYGTIEDSFWDTDTSGTVVSDGGTGKTTAQMKTRATFTDAGWDFTTPIWYINPTINDGYPAFIGVVARIKGNPNIDQRIYQHVERMDR